MRPWRQRIFLGVSWLGLALASARAEAPEALHAAAPPAAVPLTPPAQPAQFAREPGDAEAERAARALVQSLAARRADLIEATPAADPARTAPRPSALGLSPSPALPKPRTHFAVPADDPAGVAAREIARRVAAFPNLRAVVPGATWRVEPRPLFSLRARDACLRELARQGIRAEPVTRELTTPVATPVALRAPIEGVAFVSLHSDREVELSCDMALRLKPLARVLRKHGVLAVGVNSSYRDHPKVSFHSFGLALDIMAFRTDTRTLIVADHFEVAPDARTCEGAPQREEGKALLALVCAIADSALFSSVLTPNYNEGHRDHVHLDARPDDPRRFVR